jgi:predicted nucleic acid-binding protein
LGVIDTNTVILLDRIAPTALPTESVISAITLAELSAGPLTTDDPAKQAVRQARLQEVEATLEVLPFDAAAARAFAGVASSLRRAGRKTTARTFDALIAAIAIANGLAVYTCNPDDFEGIDGLAVVAIPHPG